MQANGRGGKKVRKRVLRHQNRTQQEAGTLRTLIDNLPDGIFLKDVAGRFTFANQFIAELMGAPDAAALQGKTDHDFYPKEVADVLLAAERVVMEGRQSQVNKEASILLSGRLKWILTTKVPLVDAHGEVTGLLGITRDITERHELEESLEKERSLLLTLINNLPDYVYMKDRDSRFILTNKAEAALAGASDPKELIGKTDYDLVPKDLADRFRMADLRIIESGIGETNIEEPSQGAGGATRSVLTTKVPIFDADGTVTGLVGISRDITDRKELERKNQQLATLVESSDEAIVGIDLNHTITAWNKGAEQLYGYAAEEIIGSSTSLLIPSDLNDEAELMRQQVMQGRNVKHWETTRMRKDGSRVMVAVTLSAIHDPEGRIVGLASTASDITDRKLAEGEKARLEGQLQQAQKMESVGRLAGGVAHDFNNMLGVILGHTEMALEQLDPAQTLHSDLEEIRNAAQRSADLTRQLLVFARRQTVVPKVLDLNEVVGGMLTMLERLIGENVHLTWLPETDLWPIMVDRSQIDQLLTNLCVNARDAIADVGRITIETGNRAFDEAYCADHAGFVSGEYVLLAVTDDGSGMDTETLSHIFEPFFTTKEIGKGTGLGLATVYGIVKQNNGFINTYSEPGNGTRFTIFLPRHSEKTEQGRRQETERPAPRGHETILLVEDEPASLKMTKKMLETQGYTVVPAGTPGEAIRLAREHSGEIHLLMTDVVMPEMNGRDLARNLVSLSPRLKCLFSSGYMGNVISQGVLNEGMHFIQKPFSRRDLAAKIREALDGE
jgi:two-component system, cell cycle sensor histidine kinase and response regulator CckA